MKHFKNVLMIAVDDLRPEINCFGKTKLHTPNLDRLAGGGLRFDHAYPTICELIGLPSPSHLQGASLKPLLMDPQRSWKTGILSRFGDSETLRTDRYRFTRYAKATPEGDLRHLPNAGTCELFDLHSDPRENTNVARHPAYFVVVAEMNRLLTSGWRALLPDGGNE